MEVDSEKPTVEDLPDEVLLEIFLYLTPKNMKIAALVNKRWNDVIGQFPEIMKHFRLNLEESELNIKKTKSLLRQFQNVKIKNLIQPVLEVLAMHNLKSLTISCCRLDINQLILAIKQHTVLEEFRSIGVNIEDEGRPENVEKIKFKKLTNLHLQVSDLSLVEIFDVTSLIKFHVSSYLDSESAKVIELVQKQNSLQELSIGGVLSKTFFSSSEASNFPFRLKILKLEGFVTEEIKFLQGHVETLEHLIIQYPLRDIEVLKFILQNLPKLKHLQLPIKLFEAQQLKNIIANRRIKSLKICGGFKNDAFKQLMIFLPFIEQLDISETIVDNKFHDSIRHISKTYRKLKSLSVPFFVFHEFDTRPLFPKLKELTVARIMKYEIFDEIIIRHSKTLERICIKFVDDSQFVKSLTVNKIMSCQNLKEVTIGCESPLVVRMFNNKINRPQPWTFEARIKSKLDEDYTALKFKFPDDIAVWEEKCRIYDDQLIRDLSTVENYGTNAFVNKFK